VGLGLGSGSGAPAFRVFCGGWGTYEGLLFLDEDSVPCLSSLRKLRGRLGPMNLSYADAATGGFAWSARKRNSAAMFPTLSNSSFPLT
jgi:hypothetical protein